MKKRTKQAIEVLSRHLEDLKAISNVKQGNTWKASVRATFNLYLGRESALSDRLSQLYFTKAIPIPDADILEKKYDHIYDETAKQDFRDLIQSAIKHIETNGIYKALSKKNFLSSFNNVQLISGLFVFTSIIFGAGKFYSDISKKEEISEYKTIIKDVDKLHKADSIKIDSLHKIVNSKQITH
ncbi:hypothetical protein [Paludibacter sp.]|uniref:hypothetical protein n=1 Tax=Paludibacter sp. TaxID=1898105 RepID=UPI001355289E|nr:hypothetical protein [Paludibacter sp.]MTK54406.1 hypothetical protein [Paludibacter sp.]